MPPCRASVSRHFRDRLSGASNLRWKWGVTIPAFTSAARCHFNPRAPRGSRRQRAPTLS